MINMIFPIAKDAMLSVCFVIINFCPPSTFLLRLSSAVAFKVKRLHWLCPVGVQTLWLL